MLRGRDECLQGVAGQRGAREGPAWAGRSKARKGERPKEDEAQESQEAATRRDQCEQYSQPTEG